MSNSIPKFNNKPRLFKLDNETILHIFEFLNETKSIECLTKINFDLMHIYFSFNMLNIEGLTYISPAISTHRYLSTFLTFLFEIPCGFCGWVLAKKYFLSQLDKFFKFSINAHRYSMRNTMVFCSLLMAFSIFMCVIFLLLTGKSLTFKCELVKK